MGRKSRRPDIAPEDVARRWLTGETTESIALFYETTISTIKRRLAQAREEHPGLPWDERSPVARDHGAIRRYTQLNDGHPGESVLRSGSVVRSSALRKRP